MNVAVREATHSDIEAVREVAEGAWYAAYGGFLEPATVDRALEEYYDAALVESAVEHDDIAFYVAELQRDPDDEKPDERDTRSEGGDSDGERRTVGFASAEQTWADEVELHTIYVHPDWWGRGVGSALLEHIEAWARRRDVDRIVCGVLSENLIGIGFLESRGFNRGVEAHAEVAGEFHPEYEFELPL